MAESHASTEVALINSHGLHARPSTLLVGVANGFRSRLTLTIGGRSADGKSIMEVMMLASPKGTVVRISADGPDAEAAVSAVRDLIARGFDEELM